MKANARVGDDEVTVYLSTHPNPGGGGKPKTCHYCGKKGVKIAINVEKVVTINGEVGPELPLYKNAANKVQLAFLHGRGVCGQSDCTDKYHTDCNAKKQELGIEADY